MRSSARTPVLVVCALALAACFPGIAGSGRIVTESRMVGSWTKLAVHNGMTVTASEGSPSLTVRTDDNLLGYIETYVEGDTLVVRQRPNTTLYATVAEVTLSNPVLAGVEVTGGSHFVGVATSTAEFRMTVSGGSHAEVSQLASNWMRLEASGGSHVTTSGGVRELVLIDSGGSHVGAASLTAASATVSVSGGSHLDLAVINAVEGDVSGGSHVTLYGRPADVRLSVSGGSTVTYAGD